MTSQQFKTQTILEALQDGKQQNKRLQILGNYLRQDTNTLMFSNRNYGKSVLAVQIALNVATGQSFDKQLKNECDPMKVLLMDFENDNYILNERHSKIASTYDNGLLADNFKVVHLDSSMQALYGGNLLTAIESEAIKENAKLIIIDNITKLLPDLLRAEEVVKTIDMLNRIREKTGASFLIIGHTSKNLESVAINENSYYGSVHIGNFFQEIFYIDKVKDTPDHYFLRHSKRKHGQMTADVPVLELTNNHPKDGLGFKFASMQPFKEVQMPTFITGNMSQIKPSDYADIIKVALDNGIRAKRLTDLFNCSHVAISKTYNRK